MYIVIFDLRGIRYLGNEITTYKSNEVKGIPTIFHDSQRRVLTYI